MIDVCVFNHTVIPKETSKSIRFEDMSRSDHRNRNSSSQMMAEGLQNPNKTLSLGRDSIAMSM